jgi:hypothetical protein
VRGSCYQQHYDVLFTLSSPDSTIPLKQTGSAVCLALTLLPSRFLVCLYLTLYITSLQDIGFLPRFLLRWNRKHCRYSVRRACTVHHTLFQANMRYSHRLLALVVVQIVFLYFGWRMLRSNIYAGIDKAWTRPQHRVVVFGDSWSDTGEYRVSPPAKPYRRARDQDHGEVWTEVLCKNVRRPFTAFRTPTDCQTAEL